MAWIDCSIRPIARLEFPGEMAAWLSLEEQSRLAKLSGHATRRRAAMLASHWLGRELLARRFGGDPSDWRLGYAESGRPVVIDAARAKEAKEATSEEIHISIAHSGPLVVCAISDRHVGIDLEFNDSSRDIMGLAAVALGADEVMELKSAESAERRTDLFYEMWCAKEAWLKTGSQSRDENLQLWDLQKIRVRRAGSDSQSHQAFIYRDGAGATALAGPAGDKAFSFAVAADTLNFADIHWIGHSPRLAAHYLIG